MITTAYKNNKKIGFILFLTLIVWGTIACSRNVPKPDAILPATIAFSPQYIHTGVESQVKVELTLTDPMMSFAGDKLKLERQINPPDKSAVFVPIGLLRDDGLKGDRQAGDSVFTGTVALEEKTSGVVIIRARGLEKSRHQLLYSPSFPLPVQLACGPTATILPVKIFEGNKSIKSIEFNVHGSGEALLRVTNGARLHAPAPERFQTALINLNNKRVVSIAKSDNVVEMPIVLMEGNNTLSLSKFTAHADQRLSVNISACADSLTLAPITDTLFVGDRLVAEAKLTGLRVPIANAEIKFSLADFDFAEQTATTNDSGIARITFPPFIEAGSGNLYATTTKSNILQSTTPVTVAQARSIGVHYGIPSLRIKEGSAANLSTFIDLLKADKICYEVSINQTVTPSDSGLTLDPNNVQTVTFDGSTRPRLQSIQTTIQGLKAGHYELTSRATLTKRCGETGPTLNETTSATLLVDVEPDSLVLDRPTIRPGAIPIATSTLAVFQTTAHGVPNLPDSLSIEECIPINPCVDDPTDASWELLPGELRDNGQGPDSFKADGVYSGELQLSVDREGQALYRIIAKSASELIVSKPTLLQVSRFPLESNIPLEILESPEVNFKLIAEKLLVGFRPATTSDRIEAIVNQVSRAITGDTGRIIGQLPQIGVFEVKLTVADGLSTSERIAIMLDAVSRFNTYEEVRFAEPDQVIAVAGINEADDAEEVGNIIHIKQWGLPRIHAEKAWDTVTSPGVFSNNTPIVVAIVDTGVRDDHIELSGQLLSDSEIGDNGAPPYGHGTGVAAVIAAKKQGNGITGIAYNAKLYSAKGNCLDTCTDQISPSEGARGIIRAADKDDVKIINLSWNQYPAPNPADPLPTLECALRYAAYQEGTELGTVSIDEQCSVKINDAVPNELRIPKGRGKLVVSAAGNNGQSLLSTDSNETGVIRFPCFWDNLVLCVGNSTVDNPADTAKYPEIFLPGDLRHKSGNPNTADWQNLGCSSNEINTKFSNHGDAIDLYAPGTCIFTASKNGIDTYARITGTSFSAPHVSGAAALLWADMGPSATATNVRNRLIECSGTSNVEGTPVLDLFKSVSRKVDITLERAEADFQNLFGIYIKSSDPNEPITARIVHHIQTPGGGIEQSYGHPNYTKRLYLTQAEKDNIGYFLIPDGYNRNPSISLNIDPYTEPEYIVDTDAEGDFCIKPQNSTTCLNNNVVINGRKAYAWFSDANMNIDQFDHFYLSNDNQTQNWEDLPISPNQNHDFNDVTVQVNFHDNCEQ